MQYSYVHIITHFNYVLIRARTLCVEANDGATIGDEHEVNADSNDDKLEGDGGYRGINVGLEPDVELTGARKIDMSAGIVLTIVETEVN